MHRPVYRGFNDALLSLRGIAAFLVLIFHSVCAFRINGGQPNYLMHGLPSGADLASTARQWVLFVTNGHAAVVFFFVHSGFVLTLAFSRSRIDPGLIGKTRFLFGYYAKRFFRLWPMIAVSCMVMFAYQAAGFAPRTGPAYSDWYVAILSEANSFKSLLRNLLLQAVNINPFLWSLVIEAGGSILMPAFYFMGRRVFTRYLLVLAFFVAVVGLSRAPAVTLAGWSVDALKLEFVFCMAVGSIVAFSFNSLSYVFRSINRNFAITVAIVALLCARWLIRSIHVAIIVESLASSVIVFVVYYFDEGPVQWFCNLRPVKFYGAISYSFYVNSLIAIHVAGMIVGSLLGNDFLLRSGLAGVVLVAITALAINTPFSWLTYSWIERPFMRFGRKLDGLIVARRFAAEAANVAQAPPLLDIGGQPMDEATLAPQHYPGS